MPCVCADLMNRRRNPGRHADQRGAAAAIADDGQGPADAVGQPPLAAAAAAGGRAEEPPDAGGWASLTRRLKLGAPDAVGSPLSRPKQLASGFAAVEGALPSLKFRALGVEENVAKAKADVVTLGIDASLGKVFSFMHAWRGYQTVTVSVAERRHPFHYMEAEVHDKLLRVVRRFPGVVADAQLSSIGEKDALYAVMHWFLQLRPTTPFTKLKAIAASRLRLTPGGSWEDALATLNVQILQVSPLFSDEQLKDRLHGRDIARLVLDAVPSLPGDVKAVMANSGLPETWVGELPVAKNRLEHALNCLGLQDAATMWDLQRLTAHGVKRDSRAGQMPGAKTSKPGAGFGAGAGGGSGRAFKPGRGAKRHEPGPGSDRGASELCDRCGRPGHRANSCSLKHKDQCRICKKRGHWSRNCPENPRSGAGAGAGAGSGAGAGAGSSASLGRAVVWSNADKKKRKHAAARESVSALDVSIGRNHRGNRPHLRVPLGRGFAAELDSQATVSLCSADAAAEVEMAGQGHIEAMDPVELYVADAKAAAFTCCQRLVVRNFPLEAANGDQKDMGSVAFMVYKRLPARYDFLLGRNHLRQVYDLGESALDALLAQLAMGLADAGEVSGPKDVVESLDSTKSREEWCHAVVMHGHDSEAADDVAEDGLSGSVRRAYVLGEREENRREKQSRFPYDDLGTAPKQLQRQELEHAVDQLIGDVKENSMFTDEQCARVDDIFRKHLDVFRTSIVDDPPAKVPMQVLQPKDASVPLRTPWRNIKYKPEAREAVDQYFKQLEEAGWVEKVPYSPAASPVLAVKKPHAAPDAPVVDKYRICADLRYINAALERHPYKPPDVLDDIRAMHGYSVWSVIDLKAAFWLVPTHPDSIKFNILATHDAFYASKRSLQGNLTSAAVFQQGVREVLRDVLKEGRVHAYMDDLVVHTDTAEEHLEVLERLFGTLHEAGLKVAPGKCQIGRREVTWVGRRFSKDGVSICNDRIQAIIDYPAPQNAAELSRFLGMVGWLQRSVRDGARLQAPLRTLLKHALAGKSTKAAVARRVKITPGQWGATERAAFDEIKEAIASAPILNFHDPGKQLAVLADASDTGFGVIVLELDCNVDVRSLIRFKELDAEQRRVVGFHSGRWNATQAAYATNEKEALAVLAAVEHFPEVHGATRTVLFLSDHANLVKALTGSHTNKIKAAKWTRWALVLGAVPHVLVYAPGVYQEVADALSRVQADKTQAQVHAVLRSGQDTSGGHGDASASDDAGTPDRRSDVTESTGSNPSMHDAGTNHRHPAAAGAGAGGPVHQLGYPEGAGEASPVADGTSDEDKDGGTAADADDNLDAGYLRLLDVMESMQHADAVRRCRPTLKSVRDASASITATPPLCERRRGGEYVVRSGPDKGAVFLPETLRLAAMAAVHCGPCGHCRIRAMMDRLRGVVYWPGKRNDVAEFCTKCLHCAATRPPFITPRPLARVMRATVPFTVAHVDFCSMEALKDTKNATRLHNMAYVLTVKDEASGLVRFFPTVGATAAMAAASFLEYLAMAPRPVVLCSDRGSHFLNQMMEEMARQVGFHHHAHVAYAHRSSGTVESAHRELLRVTRCLISQLDADVHCWPFLMGVVSHTLNSTPSPRNGGLSAFEVVYGLPPPPPLTVALCDQLGGVTDLSTALDTDAVKKRVHKARAAFDYAGADLPAQDGHVLLKELRREVAAQRKTKEFKNRPWGFEKGDFVMVSMWESPRPKLSHVWTGPWVVKRTSGPRRCIVATPDGRTEREAHFERVRFVANDKLGGEHDVRRLQQFFDLHRPQKDEDVHTITGHRTTRAGNKVEMEVNFVGRPDEPVWLHLHDIFAYELLEQYVKEHRAEMSPEQVTAVSGQAAQMRAADVDAGVGTTVAPARLLVEDRHEFGGNNKRRRTKSRRPKNKRA